MKRIKNSIQYKKSLLLKKYESVKNKSMIGLNPIWGGKRVENTPKHPKNIEK